MVRAILRSVGWTVFTLAAFVLSCRVVNAYGQAWGFVAAASCFTGWACHTERSARIIGWFREALASAGISEKAAAIDMGISKAQLSEGFAGTEQLSFSRAASIDDAGWEAFALQVLRASGKYIVLERGVVADLVLAVHGQHVALREMAEPARPQLAFSSEQKRSA